MTEKIPEFLQDGSIIDNAPLPHEAPKPLLKTLGIFCLVWLALVLTYLHFFYGWGALSALMPADFVLFLAAFFIFPLIVFLMLVFFKKMYSTLQQNEIVEQTLNRFLKTNDENLLSKIINKALQNQIEELNSTLQFLSAQTDSLKTELQTKAEDFHQISESLDKTAKQNLARVDENKNAYIDLCRELSAKASESATNLKTHTDALKDTADQIYQQLNPLIDETMATADHLKTMVDETQSNMTQTKTNLAEFEQMGKNSLSKLSEMIIDETKRFEQSMLRTSDNCEQIYQKIDSGISHIENSLKTHKQMASEQSALLDKNATFLDSKLGEYGKLISMEVSAMVDRASTLDFSLKEQIKALKEASTQVKTVLDGASNSLSAKSDEAIKNIDNVLDGLSKEVGKISDFVDKTEKKNIEIQETAAKMSDQIAKLSTDFGLKVDDLRLRSVEAIDGFNQASAVLNKNTTLLSENANMITAKSRQSAEFVVGQNQELSKTAQNVENIHSKLKALCDDFSKTEQTAGAVFASFEKQMADYKAMFDARFAELKAQNEKSEQNLTEIKARYAELSIKSFMDKLNEMVASLEDLSIDLNSFFDKDAEDDLWKKFYDGDHGAFAHHMVKKLGRKEILKIKDLYQKNADFRKLADSYLAEFEVLLKAAQNSEKPETLLAIISGAEVGKIYYIMARALDKLS
ncbi:MAG: hypothetical protein IJ830_06570 [Alphaproteobacteria bacterium]|nr:hypothetical protein [Alphaproteobacteria bacterium]